MKTLSLLFIGLLFSGMSYSQLTVKKVTSEVALDGLPEETFWDTSSQITIGNSNNTANFGVLWDDDYLYVGVNVVDERLCTNGRQGWHDDGIEIYIDGDYSQGTTIDQFDRRFVKPVKSYWIQEAKDRSKGVIHQWIKTSNGYSMEFAIPWNNFNIHPIAGMNIGFNIAINDDDNNTGYHLTQLIWSGNSNYYKDPSCWGTLVLSDQSVSYSGNYISLINPNGGDFWVNNKTTTIKWVSSGITNINIEYSINNGNSWHSIIDNLDANTGQYLWNVSATSSNQCLIKIYDSNNPGLNDVSKNLFTVSPVLTAVEPLIPNTWKNYQWPYNAYFPEDPNGINGHVGSACGHASLARILHYWEFPIIGNDELTFTDNGGHIWSANFGATTYNYDNMPNYLPENSTEAEYADVATLTYHAAISMHDIYGSGGDLNKMAYAMSHYFNYKESTPALRKNYTKAEWTQLLMNELDHGRVLLVQGMTKAVLGNWRENNNIAGHWFHVDGYNAEGLFHGVLGYGDEDGWYDIESLFDYYLNNGVLTGLEPNRHGKVLSLNSLNGDEISKAGVETEISWTSTGISDIRIEYTIDNGKNWNIISNNTSASLGSYNWTTPNISSDDCKIKLTDVSNINVYDKSNAVFSIKPYELTLNTPNGSEYYIAGSLISISWEISPVSNIKIEYTTNNGNSWDVVASNVDASLGSYDWIIPNTISNQCKIKISDISNTTVFDESDNSFEIGPSNNAGGPYAADDNTVLLLNFDWNLTNSSTLSGDGVPHGSEISYSSDALVNQNQCLNLDGSSYITIPHNENLNLTGDWTIEAWIKITAYPTNTTAVIVRKPGDTESYYSNYAFEIHPWWGNILHGLYFSDTQTRINVTDISPALNKWYHIAFIRDVTNSQIKIIVHDENWDVVSTRTNSYPTNDILLNSQDIRIGESFNGYMDELRISNIVRSFENIETGIDDKSYGNLIALYPNPSSKNIYISSPKVVDLSIVSITGQKVIEINDFLNGNIDISTLKKGVYMVMFSCEKGIASKKLIIE